MGELMNMEGAKESFSGEGIISVTLRDRAMGQEIPRGSTVFVDTNDHQLESGALYLIQHYGFDGVAVSPTVRRAFGQHGGVVLEPANPEFRAEIIKQGENNENIKLVGRVRGAVIAY